MRKLTLAAVMATLLVAGCAHRDYKRAAAPPQSPPPNAVYPSPLNPLVTVDRGAIRLDRELLVFQPGERGEVIWSLPLTLKFRFPVDGIVIEGRVLDQVIRGNPPSVALDPNQKEIVNCKPLNDGLQFRCDNLHTFPGVYKYTIKVNEGERVFIIDPPWINM